MPLRRLSCRSLVWLLAPVFARIKFARRINCSDADIEAGMDSVLIHGDCKVMSFSISGGDRRRGPIMTDASSILSMPACWFPRQRATPGTAFPIPLAKSTTAVPGS